MFSSAVRSTTSSLLSPSGRRNHFLTFAKILVCLTACVTHVICFCPKEFITRKGPVTSALLLSSTTNDDIHAEALIRTERQPDIGIKTTITLPSFSDSGKRSALHQIHVQSLLSDEQVDEALKLSIAHAEANGRFVNPDSDRHITYATCDFPVDECEELETFLDSTDFQKRLFDQFADLYEVDADDMSFNDLFVAYYQAKPNRDGNSEDDDYDTGDIMDRLELHRDGSLFSFSLLLNAPDEFDGGGTFYDALRDVKPEGILHSGGAIRPERAGDAVLHCGKILHGADVVTSGRRIVLVGFVDVSNRNIRTGTLGNACKVWGRQDVAEYRFRRQEKKGHKGWKLSNTRWLSKNSSALKGFVPASSGVIRRADSEDCRRRRLEAEDNLLQDILLPPDERGPKDLQELSFDAFQDGSISFLPEISIE